MFLVADKEIRYIVMVDLDINYMIHLKILHLKF